MRSLLTDIGPREHWTDTECETVSRDGILLPSRGPSCEQEEFLTQAKAREEQATDDASSARRSTVCMLCKIKPSCYTCPRCNLHYCGLTCYQCPDHSVCSEEFYKESVLQELKNMGKTESEGTKKMQEILLGLRQKAERTDGGMERLLKEAGIVSHETDAGEQEATEKVQIVELLSRLAELQQSEEASATDIEDIFRKLEEIGGCEVPGIEKIENAEEQPDLTDRFSGLEIDKLSEEDMWELLDSKEKEMFIGLMKSGALAGLVPLWKPWWERHEEGGRSLVEMLPEEVSKQEMDNSLTQIKMYQEVFQKRGKSPPRLGNIKGRSSADSSVPPISAKIPKLSSLCPNPSPLVCYSLVNALYGYTFTLSFLNGDTDSLMFEFCDMILDLSEALSSRRVFSSVQEALDCGETLILRGGYLSKEDPLSVARAVEAVAHLLTGRGRKDATGYCVAALSQLRSVLSQARSTLSKEGQEGAKRQKYFLASKKCEFFQAWVLDNTHQICRVATELWNEHSRKESARNSMKKAKTVVEKSWQQRKKKEKKLIEDMSY